MCALIASAALGGCVANSSNPGVLIRSASCDERAATFELDLFNPGGRDLSITRLDYEVSHGESMFPVARSAWTGELNLPKRGHASLTLQTSFDSPPMEPQSRLLHLSGEMSFVDRTGFLGLKSMDLTKTTFRSHVEATGARP